MSEKKEQDLKSLFKQAKEINEKEQTEKAKQYNEEVQKQLQEEEKQREKYESELLKDKINILKDKQGDDENSLSGNQNEVKANYTFKQKVSNFFYHNKWWLGIGCFLLLVAGYITYDVATSVKPDMTIMLLANDDLLYEKTASIQEIFGEYCGDRNGDGEVNVSVFYMPLSDYLYRNQPEMYTSSTTKLAAILQTDSTLLVIADKESSQALWDDELLLNIEKYYPDNENVKDTGFYLSNTDFADKTGYSEEGEMPDDVYIGIRKVQQGASYEESMRENFNEDFKLLQEFIEDFS